MTERRMQDGVQYTRHFTTMGDSPAVRQLIDLLIAEGFDFDRDTAEWVKPAVPGEEWEVRGRLSGNSTRAWLHAPSTTVDGVPHWGATLREVIL